MNRRRVRVLPPQIARALVPGLLLGLTLTACQSTPPPKPAEPFRNIYTQDRDSAPVDPRTVDFNAIPDAVPRDEPRSKYGNKSPYVVLGKTYTVLADARGYRADGIASWYGEKFHGHRTSSFEPYDMYAMTAAHTSLPIPSYVRVTNLDNNRSVVVRVNDRGPFHPDRIIDLSWAAAHKLDYAARGTARVRVEALVPEATPDRADSATGCRLQLGAFAAPDAARRLADTARTLVTLPVQVISGDDGLHRVQLGPCADRADAERISAQLRNAGIANPVILAPP